jgi:general secretion pathway protein G
MRFANAFVSLGSGSGSGSGSDVRPPPLIGCSCRTARPRTRRGFLVEEAFSVIELLLVVALLGTLAAIAVPTLFAAIDQARITRAVADIRAIELDVKTFMLTQGRLPDSLSEVRSDTVLDPWGNPYIYTNLTTTSGKGKARKDRFLNPLNSDFDLYSLGEDGASSTPLTAKSSRDDIVRANDGAFVGLASEY